VELQPESISRGNERILFVDDTESIVDIVELMLQNLGYKVTGFTDGREALKVFSEKPSEFDLVITDYVMPDLTGVDIAQKMIGIRSDIPIILCTGYSDLMSSEKAIAIGFREHILKPFNHQDFTELVRRVLDQKEPGDK
jgi:DNA-binding NtrC family response regulator